MSDTELTKRESQEDRKSRRFTWLVTLGIALLLVALASAVATLRSVSTDTDLVEHTLEVEASITSLASYNERLETARRGFLLQPDRTFIKVLTNAQRDFDRELENLDLLTSDNRLQQERLEIVRRDNERRKAVVASNLRTPAMAAEIVRTTDINTEGGTVTTREIRRLVESMRATEKQLLSMRNRAQLESLVQFYVIGGLAVLIGLSLLLTVLGQVLRNNRELKRTQTLLHATNEGLEAAVAARTAELTRANGEIQKFAYIVSHDLRSPLVNILGFTSELDQARKDIRRFLEKLFVERPELHDEQAWRAADEDLPEALGFIRTSTEKMDRLINSILALSRQGRRQLTPEMLDMTAMAEGIAASLHQMAEDAGAEISVEPIPALESDRVAVEQILSNLTENALKYLSPSRPGKVTVSGFQRGRSVMIDVTDNGRGIAPEDHERIFELFRRAGTQDKAGEGIGLANVRALAYRLGGHVEVDSKLDEGARFRLTLPEKFVAVETFA